MNKLLLLLVVVVVVVVVLSSIKFLRAANYNVDRHKN